MSCVYILYVRCKQCSRVGRRRPRFLRWKAARHSSSWTGEAFISFALIRTTGSERSRCLVASRVVALAEQVHHVLQRESDLSALHDRAAFGQLGHCRVPVRQNKGPRPLLNLQQRAAAQLSVGAARLSLARRLPLTCSCTRLLFATARLKSPSAGLSVRGAPRARAVPK